MKLIHYLPGVRRGRKNSYYNISVFAHSLFLSHYKILYLYFTLICQSACYVSLVPLCNEVSILLIA